MQVEYFLKINGSQSHLNHNWVIYLVYEQKGDVTMMVFTWIAVGAFIYWILKERGQFSHSSGEQVVQKMNRPSAAEQKLKERFVNGEIDEETYMRMKELIQ